MGKSVTELKTFRLLQLYDRFRAGTVVRKADVAEEFHVNERSVQRDIEDLRDFFATQMPGMDIIYDRSVKGYRLRENTALLNNSEILAVWKIWSC